MLVVRLPGRHVDCHGHGHRVHHEVIQSRVDSDFGLVVADLAAALVDRRRDHHVLAEREGQIEEPLMQQALFQHYLVVVFQAGPLVDFEGLVGWVGLVEVVPSAVAVGLQQMDFEHSAGLAGFAELVQKDWE